MNQQAWEELQRQRAEEARRYFETPEYFALLREDKAARADLDRKHGHLPECEILKCAPGCPSLTKR